MTFTTVAFYVAAGSAPTTLTALDVLADEHVTYRDENLTVPLLNRVMAVWAASTDLERCQLESPELRRMFLEEISPLVNALIPQASIGGLVDMSDNPLELVRSEKLNVLVEHAAITNAGVVLVWLCDEAPSPVTGKIHTIRAVPDDAPVAYEWTHSPLTFSQTLPVGNYAIVGGAWVEASGIAARFMVPAHAWRPAVLANTIGAGEPNSPFRKGRWGKWIDFDFDNPPSVEMLSTGTDKGEIYLDLIQTSEGRV